jgi:hypothetical protein
MAQLAAVFLKIVARGIIMSRFYVDTAMLRNQAQKMQACANKIGNFKYQIDRVAGRKPAWA